MAINHINRQSNSKTYTRHQPEYTLLYKITQTHYVAFIDVMEQQNKRLPDYVYQEFDDYLKCGLLEHGFLRVQCQNCHDEKLVAFSCKHRGFCPSCGAKRMVEQAAHLVDNVLPHQPIRQWVLSLPIPLRFLLASRPQEIGPILTIVYRCLSKAIIKRSGIKSSKTGSVTLIQRFGSALNLNIHFHMLFLDGVYSKDSNGKLKFKRTKLIAGSDLQQLLEDIVQRIANYLEKRGLIERDIEHAWLNLDEGMSDDSDTHLNEIYSHSISYRIAVGKYQGKKVMQLQSLLSQSNTDKHPWYLAKYSGFSLHAGIGIAATQRNRLEKLCRYISRPAVSEQRLSLTSQGLVRYRLKTPYKDGTTHVVFQPLDFLSKLAALIPKPRSHLIRYHGVFSSNNRWRSEIVPCKVVAKGKSKEKDDDACKADKKSMTWAMRLKRVFNIDINQCEHCDGRLKVIACIEDPAVIKRILNHLRKTKPAMFEDAQKRAFPEVRAPPLFTTDELF